ncbi:MAG: DUF1616 domain-containing protein [Euryarchaeota archaeon]|nr:DUF1616 domain-containing protein [Euryarchaeota archaeon]MBU4608145.1 DUF1616 domain-containing protein [Euryarchaeota archaeon]MBV1728945.1 DUF1616 domain-containing protein [Methanobacterium sp.]MBV1755005.1 DUF1616 domain-containing protein [Methanobacterium sp.]
MKKMANKDLILIFLIGVSYTALITFFSPITNNEYLDVIFLFLIFIASGYSLLAVLYPDKNYNGLLKKPVLLLMLSALLTMSVSVVLKYSPLLMQTNLLIVVLSSISMILSLVAYRRRNKLSKSLKVQSISPGTVKSPQDMVRSYRQSLNKTTETVDQGRLKKVEKYPVVEKIEKKQVQGKKLSFSTNAPVDILAIIILSVLSIVTVSIPLLNTSIVKTILVGLFIFIIPGYLLMALLFPGKESLEVIERWGLAVIISLALTSVIGIILFYTPLGINLSSILMIIGVLSIILSAVAYIRVIKLAPSQRFSFKS